MTQTVEHIVFDIGKVLVHYDPHLGFMELIPDADARAEFFATVCTHDWNIEQDRGRSWEEAEALLIGQHPDKEHLVRGFRRNWHKMVPHAYDDSVAILESLLARGRDVTLLTNFASDTFAEAQQRFPFLTMTRGVTVSGEVRLIKPQREIYELHARNFELEPAATLFIDDSAANVQGAIDAGWQAIHFTGAQTLRDDLSVLGIES